MVMTTSIRFACASALLSIFCAGSAQAAYVGPGAKPNMQTVAAILKKPVDEQHVRLQGNILKKIGHDQYTFSDGTGEIVAEIDDEDFPNEPVDADTKVRIVGEVDTGVNRPPEIEVDSVNVIK